MSRNRKQWTLSLNDELETKILNYKKAYNLYENKEILSHMFDNILNLEQSTITKIDKICTDYNISKEELLTPIIEKHINKYKDYIIEALNKKSISCLIKYRHNLYYHFSRAYMVF